MPKRINSQINTLAERVKKDIQELDYLMNNEAVDQKMDGQGTEAYSILPAMKQLSKQVVSTINKSVKVLKQGAKQPMEKTANSKFKPTAY